MKRRRLLFAGITLLLLLPSCASRPALYWAADADGGKLVGTAFAHEKPVWRLAYSGDGKTLYTVGEDRVIKAWDAAKLTESKVYDAQRDTVLDFALRPDGKQFAVARFDGEEPPHFLYGGLIPALMTDPEPHPGRENAKGHFGFAGHNDPVAFRNIQIKSLDEKK